MIIYLYIKTHNKTGLKYLGKTTYKDPHKYPGSGKYWRLHLEKHGYDYTTEILKECKTKEEVKQWGLYYSNLWNIVNSEQWANLKEEAGDGGDNSSYIPYDTIDYSNHKCSGATAWYKSLTEEEKIEKHKRTANSVAKGWYVSKVDDPTETYVHNIAQWCKETGVGTSGATEMNTPGHPMFQKQSKGWRIRREDMPPLLPYQNNRGKIIASNGCKGKTWKLENGKRVWHDKYCNGE